MHQNPEVVLYDAPGEYAVRFVRNNWKVLIWVQDLTGPKMKSNVSRPVITFNSRGAAETEVKNTIIPYLLNEKDVDVDEIIGW